MAPTTLLFVPGTRTDLVPRAAASGADLVCVDLEDGVGEHDKVAAREAVLALVSGGDSDALHRLVVRINHPGTGHGSADLTRLAEADGAARLAAVMVPKVSVPEDVRKLHVRWAQAPPVIAMVETVGGIARAEEVAEAEGVGGLLFGALDASRELGCAPEWEPLSHARSRCVLAARLAGVWLLDSPFPGIDDVQGLRREAGRARRHGFDGKAAIHPGQVPVIADVFTPTEAEVAEARRVLGAWERAGVGVVAHEGSMIDRPVVEAARRLLERAGHVGDVTRG